ncbi:MAG: YcxB family protein [Ruminococcus sp.]|nr:YcxB family protein [Ruminococcus sp.]
MVIKSENNVKQEDINALISCNASKVRFMLILLTVTFTAFLLFCMIVGNTGKNLGYCIAGIIWCVVIYAYVFFINPKAVYRSFKRRYTENAIVKYEFTAKSAAIKVESENGKFDKRKNYRDMFRIYETPEYYFFYVKRNESYIMKKSGLKQGTASELSEIILKEAQNRFVRKVK